MEHTATGNGVTAIVRRNPSDSSVTVTGRLLGLGPIPQLITWSAAAPTTRGIGFAGSGQPYPNREIAYEGTPHQGTIQSTDGAFTLQLIDIPAGYYSGLGSVYVPPVIEFLARTAKGTTFYTSLWINDTAAPYRWLAGAPATMRPEPVDPKSTGRAMYYSGHDKLPIFKNQEALLRARAYPGDMTARGWPEAEDASPWATTPSPA